MIYRSIPLGVLTGLLWGAIARLWMRWISTDVEFSWGGTLGIVIGFGIFGGAQATVFKLRQKPHGKFRFALIRALGIIFSLQLFVAAGSVMFPSVITGAISRWRDGLRKSVRALLAIFSVAFWAFIVKSEILDNFGWSIASVGRISLFATIYIVIVVTLRPTISARM